MEQVVSFPAHSGSYLCNVNFIIQLALKDVAKVVCKLKSNSIEHEPRIYKIKAVIAHR